jgi:zinc/manganese transport system permease protein
MAYLSMLWSLLAGPFIEFDFMRRAMIGCLCLSLTSAPVGIFLMLRRMSLTGDALSHAVLPGAAIGYLVAGLSLPAMTLGGLGAGLLVALLAGAVSRVTILREDTSLAAFYLLSLALGVIIVSGYGSMVDLFHVLFGNVLALDNPALLLIGGVATITFAVLAILWRPLVMECVDPGFLRAVSRSGPVAHFAFLALMVLNLVGSFSALGTLLAVGLMMLPAAAARFWTADITRMIIIAMGIAVAASLCGLLVSFHAEVRIPAGPSIVLSAGAAYLFSLLFGMRGGVMWMVLPRRHLEA